MADFVCVARAGDLVDGQALSTFVGDERVAVFRIAGQFYAIEDRCTHDEGTLSEGSVDGEIIECPRHGAKFNIRTGEVLSMPAVVPVRTFPVRVVDGEVFVRVAGEGPC
ncbi:MAG: non-heme iron oxygenase ferredoxin subunit [Candidatus Riflebacteria bacterium]|nr:non-heme iron oxygenase ferredoxin subunit [Candidatus Riflebacteria bacterium]